MTEFDEKARWWSCRRPRLGQRASDAEQALRVVVGVYSSHPTAPLSLHARVKGFDAVAFRRMDENRTALRLLAMRSSIHLVPRENAHLAFRATATPAQQGWRLRYAGVSEERYDHLRTRILEIAREPRTTRQIGAETGEGGSR